MEEVMVRRPRSSRALRRALTGPLLAGALVAGAAAPVLSDPAPAFACAPTPAAVASVTPAQAASAAAAWLATQQQPDGGFEVAGYPGFETPDAVLATAEAAQTGPSWSSVEAIAAVRALAVCGLSPLDWLDAWTQTGITGGEAAKVVVLVAGPLGLSPTAFDPSGDGDPVDLMAIIDAEATPEGRYGTFNDTTYAALALRFARGSVPAATVTVMRDAEHADGGWDYTGDLTTETPEDINTTAAAIIGLIAGGVAQDDPAIVRALGFLAVHQQPDGGWREDGDTVTNPNATALCILAIRTAGYDPDGAAWRPAVPAGAATAAAVTGSPTDALLAAQDPDGHLVGPYDDFGLNTFGTAQGVHGLLRNWLIGALPLATPSTSTTTPAPTATTVATTNRLANTGGATPAAIAIVGLLALGLGGVLLTARRRLA
jgi:LPXTG-motif cell wall-anchored protein